MILSWDWTTEPQRASRWSWWRQTDPELVGTTTGVVVPSPEVDPDRHGYVRSGTDGTPHGIRVTQWSRAQDLGRRNWPPLS